MSKLNPRSTAEGAGLRAENYEGNIQDVKRAEQQLYEIVVMTLYGKDSFYESTDDRVLRLQELVAQVVAKNNLDFIANAIVHARTEMKMRSMPIILAVMFAAALRTSGKTYAHLRQVVCDVIQRADQITDLYAYALATFGSKNKVPMAIRRGVADAFNKFNEYALQKYNRKDAVKLSDVLRIVHPKAKNTAQGDIFERLIKGKLAIPHTWETELSINGQLPEGEKKTDAQVWTELVASGDLGYMALIRNLRNIVEAGADDTTIDVVAKRVSHPVQVSKSKMFPFQFLTAYDIVKGLGNTKLLTALSRAMDASLGNLPQLGKGVWIIIDCSLSMRGKSIKPAAIFAAALAKANANANNVRITMFSDFAIDVPVNTDMPIMAIADDIMSKIFGGGTRLDQALDKKASLGFEPDTVILLSDMQVFALRAGNVENIFSKGCLKIAINLEAYDTTPASDQNGWLQLAGWSEAIFKFIPALRAGSSIVKKLSVPYVGAKQIASIAE